MLNLSDETHIYVAGEAVDGRKAINGLAALVVEQFDTPVNDGSVYVFYNKERNRIKCLFWEKNGFVIYHKRLERGKFKLRRELGGHLSINSQQLDWLCAGLDFMLMSEFPTLDFSQYF